MAGLLLSGRGPTSRLSRQPPERTDFRLKARAASRANEEGKNMSVKRMDNVLIVVDDLEATKAFFIELGLKLEGETIVQDPAVGSLIGLKDVRSTIAMMRTPDG